MTTQTRPVTFTWNYQSVGGRVYVSKRSLLEYFDLLAATFPAGFVSIESLRAQINSLSLDHPDAVVEEMR